MIEWIQAIDARLTAALLEHMGQFSQFEIIGMIVLLLIVGMCAIHILFYGLDGR